MASVTLKRAPGSTAATVTVPGGTEYKVNHDGLVEVHPDHEQHLRAAGFKHPSEVPAAVAPTVAPTADTTADTDKEPTDEFTPMNLAQLSEWLTANGATAEQVAAIKSKKAGREAARAVVAAKAKATVDPLA